MSIKIWICIILLVAGTYGNPSTGDNIFDIPDAIAGNKKLPNFDVDWLARLNAEDLMAKGQEKIMNSSELCSTKCGSSTCCGQTRDRIFIQDITTTYCCPGPNQVCCGVANLRFSGYCCESGMVCGDYLDVLNKCKNPNLFGGRSKRWFIAVGLFVVFGVISAVLKCLGVLGKKSGSNLRRENAVPLERQV